MYFLDKKFKFEQHVCNKCHDVLMMSMNLGDTAIMNINAVNYYCIVNRINKNEVI